MKKRILALLIVTVCALMFASCGCEHEWAEASCLTPKTCTVCAATEGEALGHSWADATCEAPETCARCNETQGEALDHNWTDATCEAPKTCTVCAAAEGEALPHTFVTEEPTVIEDIPTQTSTCSVCGFQETLEGEAFVRSFLSGTTWRSLVAGFDGEARNAEGVGYLTFGEDNTFICDLGDAFNKKGTWTLDQSMEDDFGVFHSFILVFEGGTRMDGVYYTGPNVSVDAFYIFDENKDYFAFIKD